MGGAWGPQGVLGAALGVPGCFKGVSLITKDTGMRLVALWGHWGVLGVPGGFGGLTKHEGHRDQVG